MSKRSATMQSSRLEGRSRPYEAGKPDPLLETITAFLDGCAAFGDLPSPTSKQEEETAVESTYGPYHDLLVEWNRPATTRQGAIEALSLAATELDDQGGPDIAHNMVAAALAYFQNADTFESQEDRKWKEIEGRVAGALDDARQRPSDAVPHRPIADEFEDFQDAQAILTLCENAAQDFLEQKSENVELVRAIRRMQMIIRKMLEQMYTQYSSGKDS